MWTIKKLFNLIIKELIVIKIIIFHFYEIFQNLIFLFYILNIELQMNYLINKK